MLVRVATPKGMLHLVNTHLGLAEQSRHWQIACLLSQWLFRESSELPTLVAGDFNDWHNTLARGTPREAGFRQITHPRGFAVFLRGSPIESLDKAFFRGPLDVRHAQVYRSRLAKTASAHLPIVSTSICVRSRWTKRQRWYSGPSPCAIGDREVQAALQEPAFQPFFTGELEQHQPGQNGEQSRSQPEQHDGSDLDQQSTGHAPTNTDPQRGDNPDGIPIVIKVVFRDAADFIRRIPED